MIDQIINNLKFYILKPYRVSLTIYFSNIIKDNIHQAICNINILICVHGTKEHAFILNISSLILQRYKRQRNMFSIYRMHLLRPVAQFEIKAYEDITWFIFTTQHGWLL